MSASQASIESSLGASPLFAALGPEGVRALAPQVKRRRFERGARVWRAGQDAAWMALIGSGLVKIVQPGGATLAIFGPHETFGELAVMGDGAYLADAVAATRSVELLCIDALAVRAVSEAHNEFARAISRSLVRHGRALCEKIRIMSAGCVERRLAALLRHLFDRFGDEMEDGSTVIQISLSRAELASLVGATIETTIRIMSRWHKQGIISTVEEGFLVHAPRRLAELLGVLPESREWTCDPWAHVSHDSAKSQRVDDPTDNLRRTRDREELPVGRETPPRGDPCRAIRSRIPSGRQSRRPSPMTIPSRPAAK